MKRTEEGGQEGRDRWVRHGSCGGNGCGRAQRMVWFGQAHGWGALGWKGLRGHSPTPTWQRPGHSTGQAGVDVRGSLPV